MGKRVIVSNATRTYDKSMWLYRDDQYEKLWVLRSYSVSRRAIALKSKQGWNEMDELLGTNSSQFNLYPAGVKFTEGFARAGNTGYFWLPQENDTELKEAHIITLGINSTLSMHHMDKKCDLSIRSVKE